MTNTQLLPIDQLRFLYAAFIDPTNLTLEEANELDTLIFRSTADLPFNCEDEARMIELEKKAGKSLTTFTGGNNATIEAPHGGCYITAIDQNSLPIQYSFASAGKPVLTITADGELIFDNVTEAAQALMNEWNRLRGQA